MYDKEEVLKELMAIDFTIIDLNLYLDTHPCDSRAIAIYNNALQRAIILRNTYERMYGPLTVNSIPSSCPWNWTQQAWPWQKEVL